MKRITIIVLTVLLISTIIPSFADEITFRDIPWGTSISEFTELLHNIPIRKTILSKLCYWSSWKYPGSINGKSTKYESGIWLIADKDLNIQVAGYDVLDIYAYFIFGYTKENKIDKRNEASRLHKALYTFYFEDVETAYADLKQKLSNLYGTGIIESKESILWNGDHNTAIRLIWSNDLNNDYHYVSIRYGKTDMDSELTYIDELARKEQIEIEEKQRHDNTNNTDGL